MRKSRGTPHGGSRKGAGRKPKPMIDQAKTPEVIRAAEIQVAELSLTAAGPASALIWEAYAALREVMSCSPFAAPRVSAAKAIIELAKAERAERAGREGDMPASGKKAQTEQAAIRTATTPNEEWGSDLMSPVRAN